MPSLNEIVDAARLSEVRVTPQATVLIKNVLDAIAEDPHPRWRFRGVDGVPNAANLREYERALTRDLPQNLGAVREQEGMGDREVTSFDFLHWLSKRLDGLCPFDK